jgi:hypothetical protein
MAINSAGSGLAIVTGGLTNDVVSGGGSLPPDWGPLPPEPVEATGLKSDFISNFLNAQNPFCETIIYTISGGTAKNIYAIVKRGGLGKGSGPVKLPSGWDYEILISHDSTSGIEEVTKGLDKVFITSPEVGEVNSFLVAGIIAKTPMCWKLGLKA